MIFNIQKCSIHDGEGLRTLVFFKGCPLRCPWCANPESQSYGCDITEYPSKCVGCGLCMDNCPQKAISRADGHIDRNLCIAGCTACTDICYAEAKRSVGKDYTIEELFHEIKKDKVFYDIKGGGVTFSGGEPLTYGNYLEQIAKKCKENRINVCIESCGYSDFQSFEGALAYIDAMFIDVKLIDSKRHKEITGFGNELILTNIKRISEYGIPITIRTPVVPGYTDSPENIVGIAQFVKSLPTVREYELLVYHNLGESKYNAMGKPYALKGIKPPSDEQMLGLTKLANNILNPHGKQCFYMKDNKKEGITC
ncbi:MAG: glycyl-radical enzyme activating protein [Firmicutes bacterium]|nr:glycyl-radical enzyme activating protein [Bacillota bacterium]